MLQPSRVFEPICHAERYTGFVSRTQQYEVGVLVGVWGTQPPAAPFRTEQVSPFGASFKNRVSREAGHNVAPTGQGWNGDESV